jgi:uncharacterized protein YggE
VSSKQQIVVRGEAERQAPADIAALTVVVQVDDTEQAPAFEQASRLAGAVDAVLDAHADALGTRQASVVVVQPTVRWVDGEEQRTGWRASRSTSLDVHALDALSPLLAALVAAGATVHGPAWRLRPDHPLLAEVRAAAAQDARARAATYAEALGVRLGRLEWVAEPGLRGDGGSGVLFAAPASAKRRSLSAEADSGMEVGAAELLVEAAVEAGFGIKHP